MTISPLLIYLAGIADNLQVTFITLAILCLLLMIAFSVTKIDREELSWGFLKWFTPAFVILMLLATLTPSTKTIYQMMIIPTAINSSVVQKLPDELQRYIDKVLKQDK